MSDANDDPDVANVATVAYMSGHSDGREYERQRCARIVRLLTKDGEHRQRGELVARAIEQRATDEQLTTLVGAITAGSPRLVDGLN